MKNILKPITTPLANIENESYYFELGIIKGIFLLFIWIFLSSLLQTFTFFTFGEDIITNNAIILGVVELLSIPLLIFIFSNTLGNKTWTKNIYRKTSIELLLYIFLIILTFRLLFDSYIMPLVLLLPESDLLNSAFEIFENNYLYLFLSSCLSAPIIEEVIFRGIILNGFLKKYKTINAIILSSLIFAASHLNIQQGINAFLLGLLLAYIYYKTHSVYLTIWAHFINNCFAMVAFIPENLIQLIIKIIISTIISLCIIFFLKKRLKFTYKSQFISTLNPNKKIYVFHKYK